MIYKGGNNLYNKKRILPHALIDKNSIKNIHNKFDIFIKDINTEQTQHLECYNVVLNQTYTSTLTKVNVSYGSLLDDLCLGSGTSPTSSSQTSLEALHTTLLNWTSITFYETIGGYKAVAETKMGITEGNGKTITEIGVKSSSLLLNRALITDINGNPIGIEKTDTMEITFYITFFFEMALPAHQYKMGNSTTWYNMFSFGMRKSGTSPTVYDCLGGTYSDNSMKASETYRLESNVARVPVASANGNGIIGISAGSVMEYIPLTDTSKYRITDRSFGTGNGTNKYFGLGFLMRDVEIKKNGVVVPSSEYTFNKFGNVNGAYFGNYTNMRSPSNVSRLLSHVVFLRYSSGIPEKTIYSLNSADFMAYKTVPINTRDYVIFEHFDGTPCIDFVWLQLYNGWVETGGGVIFEGTQNGSTWELLSTEASYAPAPYLTKQYSAIRAKLTHSDPNKYWSTTLYAKIGTWRPQIVFNTAPESGDVLTFSGVPYVIPKDADTVVDFSSILDWTPSS